jgi:myo-inositol-1(or 4)-monophosphatase
MVSEHILIQAALDAGKEIRKRAFEYGYVGWKEKDDPVTSLDKLAEAMLRKALVKDGPVNIVGEEEDDVKNGARETVYIDPIDGTKSFVRGDFQCALTVGVDDEQGLFAGVVYDFMRDILYAGYRGDRYTLFDGKRYPLENALRFGKVKISVGDDPRYDGNLFIGRDDISLQRNSGSIALSLAHLARGSIDGLIFTKEGKGNSWDVAGGIYLLDPEKFIVLNRDGSRFDYLVPNKGLLAFRKEREDLVDEALKKYSQTG